MYVHLIKYLNLCLYSAYVTTFSIHNSYNFLLSLIRTTSEGQQNIPLCRGNLDNNKEAERKGQKKLE